jgi:hypothetical protein
MAKADPGYIYKNSESNLQKELIVPIAGGVA